METRRTYVRRGGTLTWGLDRKVVGVELIEGASYRVTE